MLVCRHSRETRRRLIWGKRPMLTLLWNTVIITISFLLFYTFGQTFFENKLIKDYQVRSVSLQYLFAGEFALCCTVFELIIFEILDVLNHSFRRWAWKVSLSLILGILCVVIPVYSLVLFAYRDAGLFSSLWGLTLG
jgi:hypothetical protein